MRYAGGPSIFHMNTCTVTLFTPCNILSGDGYKKALVKVWRDVIMSELHASHGVCSFYDNSEPRRKIQISGTYVVEETPGKPVS